MEIINVKRGYGKTSQLIFQSNKKNIPILCLTKSQRRLIEDKARTMGFKIPEPISIYSWNSDGFRGVKKPDKVLIDELPMVLSAMFGCTVETATMTSGSLELYDMKDRT